MPWNLYANNDFLLTPDGKHLAAVGWQSVHVVELATGKEAARLPGRVGPAFSPDGRRAVAADEEKGIHLIELGTAKTRRLTAQQGVSVLVFSARGDRLAAGSRDGTILILDLTALPKKD